MTAATRVAAVGLGLATLLAPAAARANPADLVGFGARGIAMAGAQTAAADDGSAAYYNPALLARLADIHIDVGYQLGMPHLTVDDRDVDVDWSRGTTMALVVPGQVAGKRVAIGAGVFLPDQHITRTRTLPSPQPRFALYDNRPQRLFLSADAAVEIVPGLTAGIGLAYLSSTHGDVTLRGLIGFPQPELSDLDLAIAVDLKTVRYPHAGVAWQATPWLELGASYRGGFVLTLDQAFLIEGDVGLPGTEPVVEDGYLTLRSVSQDLFQPAEATVGLDAQLTPRTSVAFDLGWYRWSTFTNPAAHIDLDLDIGQFNEFVDIPDALPLPDPHYHDIVVPRLGVEHLAWTSSSGGTLLARAGYVYEQTPAPEQRGETNFIDNTKHTMSLGVGLQVPHLGEIVPRPLSIDAFVALTLLEARDHRKLSPVDAIGDYRSDGRFLAAGITTRWRF